MAIVTDLDHVGVGVRDLAAAARTYERLGFTLSPFARHAGAVEPGGPIVARATGNRCAMLGAGYLELIAIVDPKLPAGGMDARIAAREGVHIAAFGCADAKAADAHLRAANFASRGGVYLERMVDSPEGPMMAKFDRVPVAPHETPEGAVFYIKHLTREAIWQKQLLNHANGSLALDEAVFHVADADEAALRYGRFLGLAATGAGGVRRIALPRGTLTLADSRGLRGLLPFADVAPAPGIVGVTVRTRSLDEVRRTLEAARVPAVAEGKRLLVAPAHAHGCALTFAAD